MKPDPPALSAGRLRWILPATALMAVSWYLMWTKSGFWSPLAFFGTWSGATIAIYHLGPRGHPGLRRHVALSFVSVPLWWWFELVNSRVQNWEYIGSYDYSALEYSLFASVAFSTVVPALDALWRLTRRGGLAFRGLAQGRTPPRARLNATLIAGGVIATALVFALPRLAFPLVWVGPFLALDGLAASAGARSLVADIWERRWRLPAAVGLAGIACGFMWEFWNYWASPKWVYHVPYFEFGHVFEMPVLGYLGYIPFAWSVHQLVNIGPLRRLH